MPRKKPLQAAPKTPRKNTSGFKFRRDFSYSCSVPCINHRCDGFMFLVVATYGDQHNPVDEMECFSCRKIKRLGPHNPNRTKPTPFKKR